MGFPKILVAAVALSSMVATPALAGAERLSVARPAAGAMKDVRANTAPRKGSKLAGAGLAVGIGAAIAAGLGIAAAAGAFDPDDTPDSN